ncbi:LysR family transcriptional regulator [Saccharopolyspora gloriosae]|uniref:DNA-binding transcriptional LysR family regulator n=1 Tax=Saccharopolyspora gloriosae TaxID=455344 RepID=A0A840NJE7_9PSEU|nr:LysR family transcriptional regulator [Saccharopolyspora gloriosae]MBB5072000.1 DNA-binding transcriptional LysR family regulator [Saccharopolyspora gloriosae]
MLDARRMQVLRAVVTGGSISSAATNLGYTPSAISQQITTLEREAGTALLEKVGRGVRPTAAGRLLAERATELAGLLADADADLADLRAGRTGVLRVRYFNTAGVGLIPPAVAKFRAERPEVRLDLKMIDEGILGEVATGEADLAVIVVGRDVPRAHGVRVEHLVDEPYHLVLPLGHPLCDEERIDLARLADEPFVLGDAMRAGPCAESLRDAFGAAGFTPRIALETGGDYSAQGFVAAGLGVGLQPRLATRVLHPGVVVREVRRPEPIRRIHVATRETVADQPATRSLLAALTAAAGA